MPSFLTLAVVSVVLAALCMLVNVVLVLHQFAGCLGPGANEMTRRELSRFLFFGAVIVPWRMLRAGTWRPRLPSEAASFAPPKKIIYLNKRKKKLMKGGY